MSGWLILWIAMATIGFGGFALANFLHRQDNIDPMVVAAIAAISIIIGMTGLSISILWVFSWGI